MKTKLDELAQRMVGDGLKPNMFFISDSDGVKAILITTEAAAIEYAHQWFNHAAPICVEDRLTGVVWKNPASLKQRTQEDDNA